MTGRTAVVHYLDEDGALLATITVGQPVFTLSTDEEEIPEVSALPVVRTPRVQHRVMIEGDWWRLRMEDYGDAIPGVAADAPTGDEAHWTTDQT